MKRRKIGVRICAFALTASLAAVKPLPAFAAAEPKETAAAFAEDTEAEDVAGTEAAGETEPESGIEMPAVTVEEPENLPVPATGEEQEMESGGGEKDDGLIYVNDALYSGCYMDDNGIFYVVANGMPELKTGTVDAGEAYYSCSAKGMMTLPRQTVYVAGKAYTGHYMDNAGILYAVSDGTAEPAVGTLNAGTSYYSIQANGTLTLPRQTVYVAGKIYTGYYMDGSGILYAVSDGAAEPAAGTVNVGTSYYSIQTNGTQTLPRQTVFVAGKMYTGYYLDSGNKMYSVKEGIRTLQTGTLKAKTKYYNAKTGKTKTLSKQTLYVKGKVYSGYYMDNKNKMYSVKQGILTLKTGTLKAKAKYYSYNAGKTKTQSKKTLYVKGKVYTGYYIDSKNKMYSVKKGVLTLQTGTLKAQTKYYGYKAGKTKKLSKQTLYVNGKVYSGYYMDNGNRMYSVKQGTQTLLDATLEAGTKYYSSKEKKTKKLSGQTLYVSGKVYAGYYQDSGSLMYSVSGGTFTPVNTALGAGTEYYSCNAGKMQTLSAQMVYVYGKAMEGMSAESMATLQRAQAVVAGITNDSMTKEQKLRVCFDYVKTYQGSRPRTPHYTGIDWPVIYADDMFVRGNGNCCSYAAAFAYMAKAIGYEEVYCCNSGGHGWAEVDGLVYDPERSKVNQSDSYYALSYNTKVDVNYKGALGAAAWMHVKI